MTIDTVVFDIGYVLLDWDPRYLYRKIFADPAEMERFLSVVCPPEWNVAQDEGRPWPEGEAEAIARHPQYAEQIRAFRARWQEMVIGSVAGSVTILETLHRRGVPVYAITNFAADTFAESRVRFPFLNLFRGVIVSGEERLLKPDRRIYQCLADRYQLDLTRCVFIDDSLKNVIGARNAGMAAIHFESPRQTRDVLNAHGFELP